MIAIRKPTLLGPLLALSLALPLAWPAPSQAQPRFPMPAEVPEEVVMPRPSEAEVEQARELLSDFQSGLGAGERALFERYPYLLEVRPPGLNSAIIPNLSPMFEEKHEANKAVAAAGDIDVLFMGDSITDFWRNDSGPFAGKAVLDDYFGDLKVANFGIAGDTTQGVLYRLQNGEGEGFSPQAVMLMIGTNNTRANHAMEIAEGIGAVVLELENRFPEAEILLLAVFPRSTPDDPVRQQIAHINDIIARLDGRPRVHYLDIGEVFLDEQGRIPREVMSDGLHPGPRGYELWAEAVQEPLRALLRD